MCKEPINELDKMLFLGLVLIHNERKKSYPCLTEISIIVSIFLSLSHCTLNIFATGKSINHRNEYGLEIPTNLQFLHFHGSEKAN